MNYYLHRISHHMEWSYPLLDERGLLSIGWVHFGSQRDFIKQHQNDWSQVSNTIECEWRKMRSRFGLQRFLEMEMGDRVVVPTWGAFHVYEVADNERLVPKQIEDDLIDLRSWGEKSAVIQSRCIVDQNDKTIDLGFFRRVKLIERDIPRDEYADAALTRRMKVRQTNVQITDLRDSVENAVAGFRKMRPINLHSLVMEKCAPKFLNTILKFQNPDQFEKLIKWYFERQGASADIPAKSEREKEGDADVVATFKSLKLIVYVQAKLHEGETDAWAVEQIQRYTEYQIGNNADDKFTQIPWVISTARIFSDDCLNKAREARVRLIDGIEFAEMLLDTGIEQLDELQQLNN